MSVTLVNFDRFEAKLAELADKAKRLKEKSAVAVGIQGDGNLALIATVQEYGTRDGKIPQRPFLRTAMSKPELVVFVRKQAAEFFAGKVEINVALGRIGAFAKALVQRVISSNLPPPNKPSTVEKKGSSTTLIDTGRLRQSITWAIRTGAGK